MQHDDIVQLVKAGYTEIYCYDSENHEEAGGYQNESDDYYLVACKAKEYHQVHFSAYTNFAPRAGRSAHISSTQVIDQTMYDERSRGRTRLDDAAFHADEARQQQIAALQAQLLQQTPICPNCNIVMVKRESRRGFFWGCRNFASRQCKCIIPLSAAATAILKQIEQLRKA